MIDAKSAVKAIKFVSSLFHGKSSAISFVKNNNTCSIFIEPNTNNQKTSVKNAVVKLNADDIVPGKIIVETEKLVKSLERAGESVLIRNNKNSIDIVSSTHTETIAQIEDTYDYTKTTEFSELFDSQFERIPKDTIRAISSASAICDKQETRRSLGNIVIENGSVSATNGFSLCRIRSEYNARDRKIFVTHKIANILTNQCELFVEKEIGNVVICKIDSNAGIDICMRMENEISYPNINLFVDLKYAFYCVIDAIELYNAVKLADDEVMLIFGNKNCIVLVRSNMSPFVLDIYIASKDETKKLDSWAYLYFDKKLLLDCLKIVINKSKSSKSIMIGLEKETKPFGLLDAETTCVIMPRYKEPKMAQKDIERVSETIDALRQSNFENKKNI